MWSRNRMYSSGHIWQSRHFPAETTKERSQICQVRDKKKNIKGKERRMQTAYIPITWCCNSAVYESKNEPCKNAPTDCDIMPSCNGIAHQKNAHIHRNHQTCEDQCANIPETEYFARWIYSTKRWGGHKEIADKRLIHSRRCPYCYNSPFEKWVTYSLSIQFWVSLREGCTHILARAQCRR